MKHKTIVFEVIVDFPGNDWPVGKPIELNQYDAATDQMRGQKKGRIWFESTLRKYPGVYREITERKPGELRQTGIEFLVHEVEASKCPECGSSLTTKASGVQCSNKDCSYWFCY